MGDKFCSLCDRTNKVEHETKRLNTKSHMDLSESIYNKDWAKNPELVKLE